MKDFIPILLVGIIFSAVNVAQARIDTYLKATKIIVKKADRKMMLYANDKLLETYNISLGGNPIGHKIQEGDKKTPEGNYTISYKNAASRFHKSLKISYPNNVDLAHAKKLGVSVGGDVMIHGLGKEFSCLGKLHTLYDWTLGCVAVTNEEIDKIWKMVDVGTSIQIDP
ncbi:MAG: L,D-transpeptidase family protein [Alphaproteobacteria bacterium]|jgi:murein L,D-transpeptidase YafK|nr:L,D-transpeptidase family protein [Alphaproteobacteria bacterium]